MVYLDILSLHVGYHGIHLAEFFRQVQVIAVIAAGAITLLSAWCIWRYCPPNRRLHDDAVLPLVTVLSIWTLLVAYHRNYDTVVAILFVALAVAALTTWQLSTKSAVALLVFLVLVLLSLSFPGEIVAGLLPPELGEIWDLRLDNAITITLVATLLVSFWLLGISSRLQSQGAEAVGSSDVVERLATGNA